jgi:hypothetical protein
LSSSFASVVTNEDNEKGFSDGYDVVRAIINDVVNQLKRSSSAFDASEAKRSCVVGEDHFVNPEHNVPSCPPKKKLNVRAKTYFDQLSRYLLTNVFHVHLSTLYYLHCSHALLIVQLPIIFY